MIPFGKINGLYFDDNYEPESARFQFIKDVEAILKEENTEYIGINYENEEDYYRIMEDIHNYTKNINVYASTINDDNSIILTMENLDENVSNKSSKETKTTEDSNNEESTD